METKISILFYGKTSKITNDGLLPIYLRVTMHGKRFEITTQRYIESVKWSASAGKMKGNSEEAKALNTFLDILKHKVYIIQKELILEGKDVNTDTFRERWIGVKESAHMLMEAFAEHNDQMKQLLGKEYSPGTLTRYKTSMDHTRSFMQWKFGIDDIDVKKLNYAFMADYEFWLKSVRNCSHNTTMKYLANFKKIVIRCVNRDWLLKDPFAGFKMTKREVERVALTQEEIQLIADKKFPTSRLDQIRDIFLFCCYTGLAYADIKKLKRSEISKGIDGGKWIFTNRQKTETSSRVPLLPGAVDIMEKYKNNPACISKDCVLPVLSNQKMNGYLKEIADVCGINKNFTFHIARHTFATTVTLNNGVPIETVSKMLGHKNLRTTQHYAKLLDGKVGNDMQNLSIKLNDKKAMN